MKISVFADYVVGDRNRGYLFSGGSPYREISEGHGTHARCFPGEFPYSATNGRFPVFHGIWQILMVARTECGSCPRVVAKIR